MNVEFFAPEAQEKARERLEEVLAFGTDQLCVACAFCSAAGVNLLEPHVAQIAHEDSFLVVESESPTNLVELGALHSLAPGHVFVHFSASLPCETKVGRGLMHSKVFYARRGDRCKLWTGSHNLTANATQGINHEAAIILEGDMSERPFRDALHHLMSCRAGALQYTPEMGIGGDDGPAPEETLVIHAECEFELRSPVFHVHLRMPDTSVDRIARPPAAVILYVHPVGAFSTGSSIEQAGGTPYHGAMTALNFTEYHPSTSGTTGRWDEAVYVVDLAPGDVPRLLHPAPAEYAVVTQFGFRIDREAEDLRDALWMKKRPRERLRAVYESEEVKMVDADMQRYFSGPSRRGDVLIARTVEEVAVCAEAPAESMKGQDRTMLVDRVKRERGIDLVLPDEERVHRRGRQEYIYRAKCRL